MIHALKFHAVVSGKTLVLPDLSAFEGKRVEVIVVEDDVPIDVQAVGGRRLLGSMRGQFTVPDDFNEPLPAELQAYFEGDGEKP
jgi:hypothetical protein